jgi:hypothetical protein
MLRLNNLQRRLLSDSLGKLATYGFAGLIFVNVARSERITLGVTVVGVVVCICLFTLAVMLVPPDDGD